MSLQVTVHEAKALNNVSGRIKCRVELKQGSRHYNETGKRWALHRAIQAHSEAMPR